MNEPYLVRFGSYTTYCCLIDGTIYTKLTVILKAFGYSSGLSSSIKKLLNKTDIKMVRVGKLEAYFINRQAVDAIIANSKHEIPYNIIQYVYKDIFKADNMESSPDPYIFKFTATEMLEIYELINERPINKSKVLVKLRSGKFIV